MPGGKNLYAQFIMALCDIVNVLVYSVPQEQKLGKMYRETVQDPRSKVGVLVIKDFLVYLTLSTDKKSQSDFK